QPLHLLCAAMTGAGKSVLLQTVALQMAHQFKLIVVIDDGLCWMATCNKRDPSSRPILVGSTGHQTFTICDTRVLPVAPKHLASATALCHVLVGQRSDEDKDKLRASLLSEAISEVYASAYRRWRNANSQEHYELCVKAWSLVEYQKDRGLETFLD